MKTFAIALFASTYVLLLIFPKLRVFFEATGAILAWDNDQQKTLVMLDSD